MKAENVIGSAVTLPSCIYAKGHNVNLKQKILGTPKEVVGSNCWNIFHSDKAMKRPKRAGEGCGRMRLRKDHIGDWEG